MLKNTATTKILMGRDRHTMAPIVLTAPWRLSLLSVAITQTRMPIGAFNHPRPSSTQTVHNAVGQRAASCSSSEPQSDYCKADIQSHLSSCGFRPVEWSCGVSGATTMRRREFIRLIGGAAVAWPLAARAQQPERIARIGYLDLGPASARADRVEALRAGLRDLGYIEGKNIAIEFRWAEGNYDQLPTLVADLVRLKVNVIVTHGTPGTLAAKQSTTTIPIVFAVVGEAVGSGVVPSLARPGGNLTGLTFFQPELIGKRLELLKETMPDLTDVG